MKLNLIFLRLTAKVTDLRTAIGKAQGKIGKVNTECRHLACRPFEALREGGRADTLTFKSNFKEAFLQRLGRASASKMLLVPVKSPVYIVM